MSSYDEAARDLETKQQQAKGEESFLSFDERKQLQRMLSFPEEFPKKFGAWLVDHISLNGALIPQSQIQGLVTIPAKVLAYSYTPVDVANTSAETTLFTYDVSAGLIGSGGSLHLELFGDMLSNGSDQITIRAKFGGSTIINGGTPTFTNDADRRPWTLEFKIVNLGVVDEQDAWIRLDMGHLTPRTVGQIGDIIVPGPDAEGGLQATELGGMSIDTSAEQTLSITADWSGADVNSSFRMRNARLVHYPAPRIS